MGTLDVSESRRIEGEIQAIELALKGGNFPRDMVNVMQPYKATLSKRLDVLNGGDLLGINEEDKEKKYAQNVNIAAAVAFQDHERLVAQGFNSKEDFFNFGRNLENDSYWNWLQDNPEERKKVADQFVGGLNQQLQSGKMNANEVMAALTQNERTEQLGMESTHSQELIRNLEAHRSELTPEHAQKLDEYKVKFSESRQSDVTTDRVEAREELREARTELTVTGQVKGNKAATASIDNSFADLQGFKELAADMQKTIKEGEVAQNEITQEQASAQLAAANVENKGEVKSAGPAPQAIVQDAQQTQRSV